ncbi:C2 family cysteine protease [Leucobacter chromiiresistens]|uniref:C2 family cysteine protease n=1 Tax=Leucobacter chromiiresistens TaxID=1079994 RepID=UPI00159FA125|nr:C2 family cysteine protease [Leucobacter chromiiresistens]
MSGFGDPAAVETAAASLRSGAQAAERARNEAARARPDTWTGAAADAYRAALERTLPETLNIADALDAAGSTLRRYAAVQREAASAFAEAQDDVDRSARALRGNPLDLGAALTGLRAEFAATAALGQLQEAAATAAAELRAAIGEEGDGRPWWDPFGWFNDAEDPDERVSDNILDDDAFDPDDVAQGSIGDCFMLSSVVALLNTDAGDAFIRDHVRWDAEREGYWVTLYANGEPEEVFVEYVFDNGAKQSDWDWWIFGGDKPSIAALYEAAIRQEYGYDFIDGGVPAEAMEIITGHPVDVIENGNYAGLDADQVDELRDVLDDGGQVVISSPRSGDHQITVTDPDGNSREVDVVTSHSYVITRIDPDGSVWMRNPWGPGNSADGGGEFRVSAADVEDLFWRATMTNVTE